MSDGLNDEVITEEIIMELTALKDTDEVPTEQIFM